LNATTPVSTGYPATSSDGGESFVDRVTRLGEHTAMRILSFALRLLLAQVFLVSGVEKLVAIRTFGRSIAAYEILPVGLSNIAAVLFVWSELVVGVLFFAGAAIRGSALVTSAMLVVFIIAILSALSQGLTIDCGCFAVPQPVGWGKVLQDVGLLAAAVFLLYFPKSYWMIGNVIGNENRG